MGEEIYGDIKQYVDQMAQSLGVAAEHVYEVLVRQQIVDGVISLIIVVISVLVIVAVAVFIAMVYVKGNSIPYDDDNEAWTNIRHSEFVDEGYVWIAAVILFLSATILTFLFLPQGLSQIINPEYHAIKEIMDVFKGGN